ncbi:MAG: LruC domain-containing protein [Bacteroidales bacterium]|nr:LruC domain-containing protein [Bacteroidales bacterium]
MKILLYAAAISLSMAMLISSCRKDDNSIDPTTITSMDDLRVDAGFTFQTSSQVQVYVRMLDNNNGPVPGMRLDIYTADPDSGGQKIMSGVTDAQGVFGCDYSIASYQKTLLVATDALGFVNKQTVAIKDGKLELTLGGKQTKNAFKSLGEQFFKSTSSVYVPLGTYNSQGVPNYLEPNNDVIDNSMLQDINATLPERSALPNTHPQYFAAANEQNLVLEEACNVWVTFVHEGAGYRNVLGFYTYNTDNPPSSVSQIDSIHIIYPNTSFVGSSGGLYSGNKVYIGQYAPGTEIAWVLISDGFRNGTITNGNWVFYSDKQFNPESNASIQQHFILCNDIGRGKFLLGVEDIKRDVSSDNDFNDAVFYVSADPIQAVDVSHVPLPNYTQTDSDQDGISDNFDDYPNDPAKAFNNYFPTQNGFGSLAFEDLWPAKGDYDFNDMVIDYRFNQVTNSQNKVVDIEGKCVLRAMGAGYQNGFGIQLPVSPNQIASFTGSKSNSNITTTLANGVEAGQSKATLILFENGYSVLPHVAGASMGVNTTIGEPFRTPDTMNISIKLTAPVSLSVMGTPPYNPFIFTNQHREREVHLINSPPTDLADMSLFGTAEDDSQVGNGRYYVTSHNLPWALNVVDRFVYPAEKTKIISGYTKFVPWSVSSGTTYYDWFQDQAGYRNDASLYH